MEKKQTVNGCAENTEVETEKEKEELHKEKDSGREDSKVGCQDNSEVFELKKVNESLEKEKDGYLEDLRRLQAEFDNYRKRTEREKREIMLHGAQDLIKEILPVLDNFERALNNNGGPNAKEGLLEGVEMIFNQLISVLKKQGLEKIKSTGEPFDPCLHEAVMQVDSEDFEENIVVEEMQPGYKFNEKVIRLPWLKLLNNIYI